MGLRDAISGPFGRNMSITIDRDAMENVINSLGQTNPEIDGERFGMVAVRHKSNGSHISAFSPMPIHSATSELIQVDERVMHGYVVHALHPNGMIPGGFVHTQPRNESALSDLDKSMAREYMGRFKQFYGDDAPDFYSMPVMHFGRDGKPNLTTWVFDMNNPNREPIQAEMNVVNGRGQSMEVNDYMRMREYNAPALEQAFGMNGQR